jgi:hypothetical protein
MYDYLYGMATESHRKKVCQASKKISFLPPVMVGLNGLHDVAKANDQKISLR